MRLLLVLLAVASTASRIFQKNRVAKYKSSKSSKDQVSLLQDGAGPFHPFDSLENKCLEKARAGKFRDEVCFFDRVTSYEEGYPDTSLGTYTSITHGAQEDPNAETWVNFEGGTMCEGGPARSTRVKLVCGAEEALLSFEEPERCVYEGTVSHPSACTTTTTTTTTTPAEAQAQGAEAEAQGPEMQWEFHHFGCLSLAVDEESRFHAPDSTMMSATKCFANCQARGDTMRFFALKNGSQCSCFKLLRKEEGSSARSNECHTCPGNNDEKCGGDKYESVYVMHKCQKEEEAQA